MAHSTSTTNYKLSQFAGTDKPAWLADYNADMLAIDTNLKSVSETASGASAAIPSIQTDLDNVEVTANSAESKSTAALSNIAKAYSATSTYSIGDKVLYNNLLYKCITPIKTAESFDGTKWERISLDKIVTDLNKDLSDKASKKWVLAGVSDVNTVNIPENANEVLLEYIGVKSGSTYHTSSYLSTDLLTRYSNKIDYAGSSQIQATANIINRAVNMTSFTIEGSSADSRALFVYYR